MPSTHYPSQATAARWRMISRRWMVVVIVLLGANFSLVVVASSGVGRRRQDASLAETTPGFAPPHLAVAPSAAAPSALKSPARAPAANATPPVHRPQETAGWDAGPVTTGADAPESNADSRSTLEPSIAREAARWPAPAADVTRTAGADRVATTDATAESNTAESNTAETSGPETNAAAATTAAQPAAGESPAAAEGAKAPDLRPAAAAPNHQATIPTSDEPPAAEGGAPKQLPGLAIINPPTTGGVVHFLWNGKVVSLLPAEYCCVDDSQPQRIAFHRGDDLDDVEREIAGGVFVFAIGEAGWELRPASGEAGVRLLSTCRLIKAKGR